MIKVPPKVSAIMAVYNEAEYVSTAIESVLEQTFDDFEFLIIDDGSTDETPEIIEHYAGLDDRITYLPNHSNKGLPASLNKGIEHASGKYIARMDADDISLPRRFEEQAKYLDKRPDAHVVGSYTRLITKNGEFISEKSYPQGGRSPEQLKKQGPCVAHPSVMMRMSSLLHVGSYREPFTYAQDLDLWIRMSRKFGEDFLQIVPEPLIEYRLTPGQYSRNAVTDIYESYAGEYVGSEEKLEERISNEVESRERENNSSRSKMMYHYRVGRHLIDHGKRSRATKYFIVSLLQKPFNPRGWYGIGLVCLPKNLRESVDSYVSG